MYYFRIVVILLMIAPAATAQSPSKMPTPDEFRNMLLTCGSGYAIDGRITGSLLTIFEGISTEAEGLRIVTAADFVNAFPEGDRAKVYEIYVKCIAGFLEGQPEPQSSIPKSIELPSIIETNGKSIEFVAQSMFAHDAEIRAFAAGTRGLSGNSGPAGRNGSNGASGSGGRGVDGRAGGAGGRGGDGPTAGTISLKADEFVGDLKVINSGATGGTGGSGGAGGSGGNGGRGGSSVNGLFDCRSGPGNGGDGGDAGAGGDGAQGGAGGSGGTVIIDFGSVAPGSSLAIISKGGLGGAAGNPGPEGAPGSGGARGNVTSNCDGGGRSKGTAGTGASAGRALGSGPDGTDGQIEITIGGKTSVVSGEFYKTF